MEATRGNSCALLAVNAVFRRPSQLACFTPVEFWMPGPFSEGSGALLHCHARTLHHAALSSNSQPSRPHDQSNDHSSQTPPHNHLLTDIPHNGHILRTITYFLATAPSPTTATSPYAPSPLMTAISSRPSPCDCQSHPLSHCAAAPSHYL